jgi:hypothetical protein
LVPEKEKARPQPGSANGQQASMLAMSNQPDVVLMDINPCLGNSMFCFA